MSNGVASRQRRRKAANGITTNGVPPADGEGPVLSPTTSSSSQAGGRKKKLLNLELPRKALHTSIGFLTLPIYALWPADLSIRPLVYVLLVGLAVVIGMDLLRFESPAFRELWEKHAGKFMRESEKTRINGTVWYLLGVIICLSCYPRDIAVASILILSWCDTAASVFGRLVAAHPTIGPYSPLLPNPLFGFLPIARKKSVAGTLAGSIVGAAIAWGMFGSGWGGCVGVGFIAGLAEAVDVNGLDDNLTLPVLSGALMWAVRAISGAI